MCELCAVHSWTSLVLERASHAACHYTLVSPSACPQAYGRDACVSITRAVLASFGSGEGVCESTCRLVCHELPCDCMALYCPCWASCVRARVLSFISCLSFIVFVGRVCSCSCPFVYLLSLLYCLCRACVSTCRLVCRELPCACVALVSPLLPLSGV